MTARMLFTRQERAILILLIASLVADGCSRERGDAKGPTVVIASDARGEHFYSTTFPRIESPLEEGGVWVDGSSAGASIWAGGSIWRRGRLWGDAQSNHGVAYGVDEPTEFGDPTAILAGTWGPTQTVMATVRVNHVPKGGCCHEVELRLRTTITPRSITGYEAYCSVMPDNQYCHIARWNGPNGSYWNFEKGSSATYLANGDVITATVAGTHPTTIVLYKNGKKILEAEDSGAAGGGFGAFGPWTSGNPGIGFYDNHDGEWKSFGFSSFSATDSSRPEILRQMGVR